MSVIESLKALASEVNCTIVMTIHQPSARLFDCLDRVIFLSNGRVTYNDEVRKLHTFLVDFYTKHNMGELGYANSPELFLDLTDRLTSEGRLELLTAAYENEVTSGKAHSAETPTTITYANNFIYEILILMHRSLKNIFNTKELFMGRLFAAIGFGIQIGTLFLSSDETTSGLQHRLSYFVFTIAFFYYTSLEALPIFLAEREIFQREFSRGAYRAASYAISATLIQFPFLFIITYVYCCITWWLVGLPNLADTFFFMTLCVFTVLVAGQAFATLISVIVPNPMAGQTMGSALFSVMFLFSGFFITRSQIPDYWIWLNYLSLFKYAYESMIVNAFKNLVSTDDMTNQQILESYSVEGINRGQGIGILWAWIIFYRLLFYFRLVTAFTGSRK